MSARRAKPIALATTIALVTLMACKRETRTFRETSDNTTHPDAVRLTSLQPGQVQPLPDVEGPFRENAYGISEGKRLFSSFNCNGCHAMGGGAIGPALMDDKWIYGGRPEQIYSSIVQGRPDGMPSFAGRIPDQQVWQLVAFVQSLSANTPRDAASGRNDDLNGKKPEAEAERLAPIQTGHR
jgi:cytochrome c oxidase cbb3-type subunit 3